MSLPINIIALFEDYKEQAPKHLEELEDFEAKCRNAGFHKAAETVYEWRINLDYHIYREFNDVPEWSQEDTEATDRYISENRILRPYGRW